MKNRNVITKTFSLLPDKISIVEANRLKEGNKIISSSASLSEIIQQWNDGKIAIVGNVEYVGSITLNEAGKELLK